MYQIKIILFCSLALSVNSFIVTEKCYHKVLQKTGVCLHKTDCSVEKQILGKEIVTQNCEQRRNFVCCPTEGDIAERKCNEYTNLLKSIKTTKQAPWHENRNHHWGHPPHFGGHPGHHGHHDHHWGPGHHWEHDHHWGHDHHWEHPHHSEEHFGHHWDHHWDGDMDSKNGEYPKHYSEDGVIWFVYPNYKTFVVEDKTLKQTNNKNSQENKFEMIPDENNVENSNNGEEETSTDSTTSNPTGIDYESLYESLIVNNKGNKQPLDNGNKDLTSSASNGVLLPTDIDYESVFGSFGADNKTNEQPLNNDSNSIPNGSDSPLLGAFGTENKPQIEENPLQNENKNAALISTFDVEKIGSAGSLEQPSILDGNSTKPTGVAIQNPEKESESKVKRNQNEEDVHVPFVLPLFSNEGNSGNIGKLDIRFNTDDITSYDSSNTAGKETKNIKRSSLKSDNGEKRLFLSKLQANGLKNKEFELNKENNTPNENQDSTKNGKSPISNNTRRVFRETNKEKNPHIVYLGYGNETSIKWGCIGTLISETFVLASAHCTRSIEHGKVKFIQAGDPKENSKQNVFQIRKVYIPNDFSFKTAYNDIALIEITRPVALSLTTFPACLLASKVINIPQNSPDSKYDFLQKLDTCPSFNGNEHLPLGVNLTTQFCLEENPQVGNVCGDTHIVDYPLTFFYNIHKVVGIPLEQECDVVPKVYTRISHFVTWIESIVWGPF